MQLSNNILMGKKHKIIGLLIVMVWNLSVHAHYYNNVQVNDTPVRCLAQDNSRFVWLGTGNGLYCYDGYRCIPKYALTGGMKATVYCLKAENNLLYVGTSKGFYVLDTQTYEINQPQQDQNEVRAISLTTDGVLLGRPDGLWKYNLKTNKLSKLNGSVRDIYALEQVATKTYIGALKGFYCYSDGKLQEISLRSDDIYVNSLLADKQRNCIWVGAGDMLYKYNLGSGIVQYIPEMSGVSVKSMSVTDDNTLYIATDNGFYTYSSGYFSLDKHDSNNPHTLSDNVVWSTFIDHWGNIILGTDGGLSVISAPSYYTYLPISELTGNKEGNKFSTLLTDSKGRKWFGGSNGLFLMDHTAKRWYRQVDSNYQITHNRIRKVYEDFTGNIWIATDNGINLYDENTGRMRNLIITDKTGEYTARWAYDIIDDGHGNLWVAAFSGGIFIVPKNKLLTNVGYVIADKHLGNKKGELSDKWVRQLKKDRKGNIWAITGKGLDCIQISTLCVKNISITAPSNIVADKDGNIWVANSKELLCYTDTHNPQRYSYGVERANTETVALCDVNRQIWVVTPKECILISNEGNHQRLRIPIVDAYGAFYSANDKCFYIGGKDGLVIMYPSEISKNSQQRKLTLSDFVVNGEQRLLGESGISLSHNENNIEMCLTDFPYMGDIQMSYVYRLDGVDNVWHVMNSLEEPIVYNALPYGRYTLLIRGVSGNKDDNNDLFSTTIRILPPWYLTLWAKVVYALILQSLILWIIRFYFIRKKLKREKCEKQRIVEQSKTRMDFYNNMSRSLKQSLYMVMAPLSEIVAKGADGEQQETISAIRSYTTRMNTLISKAFDIGNIEDKDAKMPKSLINLVAFCDETLKSIQEDADKLQIKLVQETDHPSILMNTEVLRLDSILSMLIQNMLRYSASNGTLKINLKTDLQTAKVEILVSSSSMNVPDSQRPYLFQRYYQHKEDINKLEFGSELYLVKDYVEELGGTLSLEPANGEGTTFKMIFDILSEEPIASSVTEKPLVIADDVISEKDEKLMREITIAIEVNMIDSDFNVTRLQEIVGIGQKFLYRKIKQITGVTPVEYIRNIRMEKAARLLREGKFSVSEVMYMVGFTKSGYFSKCFQDAFGMTPSAYVKQTNNF